MSLLEEMILGLILIPIFFHQCISDGYLTERVTNRNHHLANSLIIVLLSFNLFSLLSLCFQLSKDCCKYNLEIQFALHHVLLTQPLHNSRTEFQRSPTLCKRGRSATNRHWTRCLCSTAVVMFSV